MFFYWKMSQFSFSEESTKCSPLVWPKMKTNLHIYRLHNVLVLYSEGIHETICSLFPVIPIPGIGEAHEHEVPSSPYFVVVSTATTLTCPLLGGNGIFQHGPLYSHRNEPLKILNSFKIFVD